MTVEKLTKADFDFILEHIVEFWGSERTLALHHPMFLHESGPTAYVIRDGDKVLAYCLGFFSQTEPAAYVHLVGVHSQHGGRDSQPACASNPRPTRGHMGVQI